MHLEFIRRKINLIPGVDIKKVHVLLLPEDEEVLKEIKHSILAIGPKQGVVIHYEHGFIMVSMQANGEMALKILYKDKVRTHCKTWISRFTYDIVSFTLRFLRGDYNTFINS